MRWSSIVRWSSPVLPGLVALTMTGATFAQGDPAADLLRGFDPPDAVLHYAVGAAEITLMPWDIEAVELSESGGITDIFVRLAPVAADRLAGITDGSVGRPLVVRVCGHPVHEIAAAGRNATGTLYLPNTTAARGEVVRALWQGRVRCDTVDPEVFADGH